MNTSLRERLREIDAELNEDKLGGTAYCQAIGIALRECFDKSLALALKSRVEHIGPFCVMLCGSLALDCANSQSDVDICLLGIPESHASISYLAEHLRRSLLSAGLGNCDIAYCFLSDSRSIQLPFDYIDRIICLSGKYYRGNRDLSGSFKLWRSSYSVLTIDLLVAIMLMQCTLIPQELSPDDKKLLKYKRGGQRTICGIMNLLQLISIDARNHHESVFWVDSLRNTCLTSLRKLSVGRARKLERGIEDSVPSPDFFYDQYRNLLLSLLREIAQGAHNTFLNIELETSAFSANLSEYAYRRLTKESSTPVKHLITRFAPRSFLEGLNVRSIVDNWCHLFAVANNPQSPQGVLNALAHLTGPHYRNIRDQVLKNPSVGKDTLLHLSRADEAFTRQRARSVMEWRLCNAALER